GTKLGLEAKTYMDKGALVPDAVVIGMISERIEEPDSKAGFILDGFPRTIPQAHALDEMLRGRSQVVDRAVLFEIRDDELVKRLSGRRTCEKCGTLFHVESAPTQKAGVCDKCGGKVAQRDDDKDEVIRKRLSVYHQQTAPLAEYYQKQGK